MAAVVRTKVGKRRTTIWVEFYWGNKTQYCRANAEGIPFKDLADAEGTAAEISGEMYRARRTGAVFDPTRWTTARPMSFRSRAALWLTHNESRLSQRQIAPSTMREKRRMFRDYFMPRFGDSDVRSIRGGHVEDFISGLHRGLTGKSIRNLLIELHAFFGWLHRREEIERVPGFPKLAKYEPPPTKAMPEEDWQKVYGCIPDEHKPLFWTMRHYGLRPAETCALRWEHIDWRSQTVEIRGNFSYGEKGWQYTDRPKSGSGGTLPLDAGVADVLSRCGRNLAGFVFTWKGRSYTQRVYDRIWRKSKAAAGIDEYSLYQAVRASFASDAANAGAPQQWTREVMRHKDYRTTQRHYESVAMERKARVIEMVAERRKHG